LTEKEKEGYSKVIKNTTDRKLLVGIEAGLGKGEKAMKKTVEVMDVTHILAHGTIDYVRKHGDDADNDAVTSWSYTR
jgi:ABC-type uncharacterized transport system ATPase subunit